MMSGSMAVRLLLLARRARRLVRQPIPTGSLSRRLKESDSSVRLVIVHKSSLSIWESILRERSKIVRPVNADNEQLLNVAIRLPEASNRRKEHSLPILSGSRGRWLLHIFRLTSDWQQVNSIGSVIKKLSPRFNVMMFSQNLSPNKSFGNTVIELKLRFKLVSCVFSSVTKDGTDFKFLRERLSISVDQVPGPTHDTAPPPHWPTQTSTEGVPEAFHSPGPDNLSTGET